MDPLLLIANAEAGSHQHERLHEALTVLREHTDVEVCETANRGELDGVLHRRGGRTVVIAGGDGSLHAVIAALHRRHELGDTPLALLPLGTGNDFARGTGVPLEPQDAARLVIEGQLQPVDLLVDCVGEVVVNNVHAGAGAEASRKSHRWKRRLGRLGYLVGALSASLHPPFFRFRVEVDGEVVADFDRHIAQVAVGNGATVGGGTEVTPYADPGDGKVDVMISYAVGPLARFVYVAQLRTGRHPERRDVRYLRGTTVTITGHAFYTSADGEVYGPERRRTWRVEPGAFRMILPPRTHEPLPGASPRDS